MRRAILIALPHTMRVLELHRRLRTGEPQRLNDLARGLEVDQRQIRRDLEVLRVQGCLIDACDGWVRMVDDHAAYDEADLLAELAVLVASDRWRRRQRRNAA